MVLKLFEVGIVCLTEWTIDIITRCEVYISALRADKISATLGCCGILVLRVLKQFYMSSVAAVNPYKDACCIAISTFKGSSCSTALG